MPSKNVQPSGGPKGLAPTVRRVKEGVKIIDEQGNEYGPFPYDRISEDNGLRDILRDAEWQSSSDGLYFSMNRNEDFLYDLHPWEGFHYLRFLKFQNQKDKPPTFRTRNDQWGNRRIEFTTVFEIVGGKWAGMTVPKTYPYIFAADPDSGLLMFDGTSKQIARVEMLLALAGYKDPDDDFEYSQNVLPTLQTILLKYNNVFAGSIENGWVKSISRADEDLAPKAPKR